SSRTQPGVSVLDSTTMAPAFAPASAPSAPSQTEREAASSATMAKITSAPAAASRGVTAALAPLAASTCALAGGRFQTERGKPLASQLAAMPPPITPRPRSATRCMKLLPEDLSLSRLLQHVRAVAGALGCFLEFLDHPVALEP